MAPSDELTALLRTLPQELFDAVREFVFTADPGERVVEEDYKPPAQLQVDRSTRARFAEAYYGDGAVFCFPAGLERAWLNAIPNAHFDKITRMRCEMSRVWGPQTLCQTNADEREHMDQLGAFLRIVRSRGGYDKVTSITRRRRTECLLIFTSAHGAEAHWDLVMEGPLCGTIDFEKLHHTENKVRAGR